MEKILDIQVKTDSGLIELDLESDLKFTPENLNQAYIEQPSKFAYWSVLAVQSKSALDRKKLEVEQLEDYTRKTLYGELDTEVRQRMEMDGEKVTEAKVVSGIYTHPRYLEVKSKLRECQAELLALQKQTDLLYSAKEAFIQRKDMIISLGANLRQEKTNIEP